MRVNPEEKLIKQGRIEKYILRKAFATPEDLYLPDDIFWRQKEQFSDGVGYRWIDSLLELAGKTITDQMFLNAESRFPLNTPVTKEAYVYRSTFEQLFSKESAVKTVQLHAPLPVLFLGMKVFKIVLIVVEDLLLQSTKQNRSFILYTTF